MKGFEAPQPIVTHRQLLWPEVCTDLQRRPSRGSAAQWLGPKEWFCVPGNWHTHTCRHTCTHALHKSRWSAFTRIGRSDVMVGWGVTVYTQELEKRRLTNDNFLGAPSARFQVLCWHFTVCPHDTLTVRHLRFLVEPKTLDHCPIFVLTSHTDDSSQLLLCTPGFLKFSGLFRDKIYHKYNSSKLQELQGKRYVRISKKRRRIFSGLRWKYHQAPECSAPLGCVIPTIGKRPGSQSCWGAVRTGLAFETPVKIVSPGPKQVFPKHPKTGLGKGSVLWKVNSLFSVHLVCFRAPVGTIVAI